MTDSLREDMRALVAAARMNAADNMRGGAHKRDLAALLARSHNAALAASGLTQSELAAHMGISQPRVARFGIADAKDVPSALHLSRAPDSYVIPFLRELSAIRTERGARPHEWVPAPELVHGNDDTARFKALVSAAANAQRAALLLMKPAASAGELKIVERELTKAAECALEAAQRVRLRLREWMR